MSAGHNFSSTNRALAANTPDVFKIALYSVANGASLGPTTTAYTTVGEVVGTGYTAGGQVLTITQSPTNSGTPNTTAYVNFATVVWSGASFSADGALIYNSTNANKAVAVFNFGGTKTASGLPFTVNFPAAGTGSAVVEIV